MRFLLAILLALQLQPPAPVLLGATFTSSTTAAVWWQQPPDPPGETLTVRWVAPDVVRIIWSGPGCLYRNQTLIACYPRDAGYLLELGGMGSMDAAFRPAPGDVFTLVRRGGQKETAELGARPIYLPVFRH